MNPTDAKAIEGFLKSGGQVLKLDGAIHAREQDVLRYLSSCGVTVRYFHYSDRPYARGKTRYSLHALVRLANRHRREQNLPPLML